MFIRNRFLISMLEKLNLLYLIIQITLVLLIWKWMYFRLSLLTFWSGAPTLPWLLKLPPEKLEPWFVLLILFLLRLHFFLFPYSLWRFTSCTNSSQDFSVSICRCYKGADGNIFFRLQLGCGIFFKSEINRYLSSLDPF